MPPLAAAMPRRMASRDHALRSALRKLARSSPSARCPSASLIGVMVDPWHVGHCSHNS
jgi:hypothetical protein